MRSGEFQHAKLTGAQIGSSAKWDQTMDKNEDFLQNWGMCCNIASFRVKIF